MNRQQALEWCVENMPYWSSIYLTGSPIVKLGFVPYKKPLVLRGNHSIITKQDWLDARAKKESGVKFYIGDTPEQLRKGVTPTIQPYMPQVGEECEIQTDDLSDFYKVTVQAFSNDGKVVLTYDDHNYDYWFIDDTEFRPLKTEREKLAIELWRTIFHRSTADDKAILESGRGIEGVFNAIDSGWIKND